MKTQYLLLILLCRAFLVNAQIGVQINSSVQLFADGHLRIEAQPLTFLSGQIITPRDAPLTSSVYFTDGSVIQGESDTRYINGYVTKEGQTTFKFPIGDQEGNDLRPLEILSTKAPIEVTVGYWKGDVGTDLDPTGGAHDRNAISSSGLLGVDKIVSISSLGFWDWVPGSKSAEISIQVSIPENSGKEGYLPADIRLVGWNNKTNEWENLSGATAPASNAEGTFVTGSMIDMTLYSAITVGSTSAPLPVKLISFTASEESGVIHLDWETVEETNAEYFEIERSIDAKDWSVIGKRNAAGESKALLKYSFTDKAPMQGNNYYRLKMVDKDETRAFSRIQNIWYEDASNLLVMYPNPVSEILSFKKADLQKIEEVFIHDLSGKQVFHSSKISSGSVDVSHLSEGLYLVKVRLSNRTNFIRKISVKH